MQTINIFTNKFPNPVLGKFKEFIPSLLKNLRYKTKARTIKTQKKHTKNRGGSY